MMLGKKNRTEVRTKNKGRSLRRFLRPLAYTAVIAAVFALGWFGGQGRIDLFNRFHTENSSLPAKLDMASVQQVYDSLKQNYDGQLDATKLEDGLKHGLAAAANDPYTTYFTAKEAQDFSNQLNNSFSGIGAQLGKNSAGNLEVIAPIDGLPAAKAGLKAQDVIAAIDDQSTAGMSVDTAVGKIRGPKGTTVKLQVVRDQKAQTISITRDDITLPSVKTKILPGNIGYIQITTFANDTSDLMQKAANDFKSKNVNGIVLDLRDNPGGLLDAAVNVSSLWLPGGKQVLQEKRGNTVIQSYSSTGNDILNGTPTVILVNSGSASASEITAGALHDNNAATVIGEKSYGKGVVQQLINFNDGSELKVTIASWYRPNGQNINKKGISPDKVVTISDDDIKASKDPQLDAALQQLK